MKIIGKQAVSFFGESNNIAGQPYTLPTVDGVLVQDRVYSISPAPVDVPIALIKAGSYPKNGFQLEVNSCGKLVKSTASITASLNILQGTEVTTCNIAIISGVSGSSLVFESKVALTFRPLTVGTVSSFLRLDISGTSNAVRVSISDPDNLPQYDPLQDCLVYLTLHSSADDGSVAIFTQSSTCIYANAIT